MKSAKSILILLAGIWTILLIIEKIFSTADSVKTRKLPLPLRFIYHTARIFRSVLLFSLVIINVFMAIALIEDKK